MAPDEPPPVAHQGALPVLAPIDLPDVNAFNPLVGCQPWSMTQVLVGT